VLSGPEAAVEAEVQFGVRRIDFLEGRTRERAFLLVFWRLRSDVADGVRRWEGLEWGYRPVDCGG